MLNILMSVLVLSAHLLATVEARQSCSKIKALGMEDGRIRDDQISASSSYEANSVGPVFGRLNSEKGGGAWCPRNMVSKASREEEFMEIDLEDEHEVTGVNIQGRFANGEGQEFAQFFVVEYWKEGMDSFVDYKDMDGKRVLLGNENTFSVSKVELDPPIVASRVRIVPWSQHPRTVCLRLELEGCVSGVVEATVDEIPPLNEKNTLVRVEGWWSSQYLGAVVGLLLTVILVLVILIVIILHRTKRTKHFPSITNISIASSFIEDQRTFKRVSNKHYESSQQSKHHEVARSSKVVGNPEAVYQEPVNLSCASLLEETYGHYSTPFPTYAMVQPSTKTSRSILSRDSGTSTGVSEKSSKHSTPRRDTEEIYKVPRKETEGVYKVPVDINGLSWSLEEGKGCEKGWMADGGKSPRRLDEKTARCWVEGDRTSRSCEMLVSGDRTSRSWVSDEKSPGDESPVTTPRLPPLPDFDSFLFDVEETDVDQDEQETNVDDDQDELVPVYANVDC